MTIQELINKINGKGTHRILETHRVINFYYNKIGTKGFTFDDKHNKLFLFIL